MELYKISRMKLPLLMEVLTEGHLVCIRAYMELESARRSLRVFNGTVNADIVGHIFTDSELLELEDAHSICVTRSSTNTDYNSVSTLIANTKFTALKHKSFGDKEFVWIGDHVIDLNKLYASQMWDDYTVLLGLYADPAVSSTPMVPLFDKFANSFAAKTDSNYITAFTGLQHLFNLWIKTKSSPLDSLVITVNENAEYGIIGKTVAPFPKSKMLSSGQAMLVATCVNTVKPDGYADITVKLNEAVVGPSSYPSDDIDIHVSSKQGYLPKTVVHTVNGTAKFRVAALGLVSGDTIELNIGFKKVSGLAHLTIGVV